MPPRGGPGMGQGRITTNASLVEEFRHIFTRIETMETAQKWPPDEGDVNAIEEYSKEEE